MRMVCRRNDPGRALRAEAASCHGHRHLRWRRRTALSSPFTVVLKMVQIPKCTHYMASSGKCGSGRGGGGGHGGGAAPAHAELTASMWQAELAYTSFNANTSRGRATTDSALSFADASVCAIAVLKCLQEANSHVVLCSVSHCSPQSPNGPDQPYHVLKQLSYKHHIESSRMSWLVFGRNFMSNFCKSTCTRWIRRSGSSSQSYPAWLPRCNWQWMKSQNCGALEDLVILWSTFVATNSTTATAK